MDYRKRVDCETRSVLDEVNWIGEAGLENQAENVQSRPDPYADGV